MKSLHLSPRTLALPLAVALLAASALPVIAQEGAQDATVAEINAGAVSGVVTLRGAALAQQDEEEYWFSDGTDVIKIDIDTTTADAEVPLLTLMTLQGQVASDEIEVSSWAVLDIMTPAVIRTPEDAIDAYTGWIITQNSQAPIE